MKSSNKPLARFQLICCNFDEFGKFVATWNKSVAISAVYAPVVKGEVGRFVYNKS